jgi:hypothetical protein
MKRIIAGIALFVLSAAGSIKVSAGGVYTPHIKHQQQNEQARIYHGVRTGQITRGEMVRLENEQARIHHLKKCAKADGKVTRRERKYINHQEAKASRHIYHQKHDGQHRF